MTEIEFWDATPAEIERVQWAYLRRRQREQVNLRTLAWLTENLHRQKRLPSLATFTDPPKVLRPEELQVVESDHERLVREMGG